MRVPRLPCTPGCRGGSLTFWLALSLGVIIGVVALGMDGGRMMQERRHVQEISDAAAVAGGANLYQNWLLNQGTDPNGTAKAAALAVAAANGYTNDGVNSVVTVNIPPKSGTFAGQKGYVEVIITAYLAPSFGSIFLSGELTVSNQATVRVVASGQPQKIGIMALQGTGASTFNPSGNGTITVLGAPIVVNSSDAAAYNQSGSSIITAQAHDITGGLVQSGGGKLLGPVVLGVPPSPDPLLVLPAPNLADYTVQSTSAKSINSLLPTILSPGVYKGGINISGLSIVTMLPGVYIMDGGGFQVSQLASVVGLDVVIFNTPGASAGPVTITSTGIVTLTAPITAPYAGISIWQDRSQATPLQIAGTGVQLIQGVVYAAAAPVQVSGTSGLNLLAVGGGYVAHTIQISGNGNIVIAPGANFPRVPNVRVVE